MDDHKVGIRELKAGAAGILRHVREQHATYVVTLRGRAVGVLMPIEAAPPAEEKAPAQAWNAFLGAGRRLQRAFRSGRGAVADLSSSRR